MGIGLAIGSLIGGAGLIALLFAKPEAVVEEPIVEEPIVEEIIEIIVPDGAEILLVEVGL